MKYKIEIYSRGLEAGIGKITQEQYEYWYDRQEDLPDALQDSYDYEDNEAPENARLYDYYDEYTDVFFGGGPDFNYNEMTITDNEGNEIFKGEISEFIDEHDPDYDVDLTDVGDRDYYSHVLDPGYYIQWLQSGKGCYFEGTFETDNFDPLKIKFVVRECDYGEILTGIKYDSEDIENDAGDYDIKSFEAEVFHNEEE